MAVGERACGQLSISATLILPNFVPAYVQRTLEQFVEASEEVLLSELSQAYAADGFSSQYTSQTKAWVETLDLLQRDLRVVSERLASARQWTILLEYPLYRLRRRIDAIVLTDDVVVVIEVKSGETAFLAADKRQVEEYALDLRDFHEHSAAVPIVPALWCTEAGSVTDYFLIPTFGVSDVQRIGRDDLAPFLLRLTNLTSGSSLVSEQWIKGSYRPVPSVIEAATSLFAGHGVREIAQADASNLGVSAERIVEIIEETRRGGERALIFLSGVPGSGKTLAGLHVVHRAVESGREDEGDIIYLSGNTPLVTVLREALTLDEYRRQTAAGRRVRKGDVRNLMRARIQHIIDFLREYLVEDAKVRPPHEHAIVFDEAQRAWDEKFGRQKFGRRASEPRLLLEIMGRHGDWSAIIGLVGGGQEINTGENGMKEWGDALRSLPPDEMRRWCVYGPPDVLEGTKSTAFIGLGSLPHEVRVVEEDALRLEVPLRSYRSPRVADWISAVIVGDQSDAASIAHALGDYPIVVTRSLDEARAWLRTMGRGERRYGLVASSGASRLRADGLGVTLNATDRAKIADWYLRAHDDVRSSYALEVTANEYTTQGLELDFVGVCWGGDFIRMDDRWRHRQFRGNRWVRASGERMRFIENSYRVLLTRAREGLIIWVPQGDASDVSRNPKLFNATAGFLVGCGAKVLDS